MSTVKLENKANELGQRTKTTEEFLSEYRNVLKKNDNFSKDVVEFSELMAKHPADVFIVSSFPSGEKCEQIRQGDVYLFRKGEDSEGTLDNVMYAKYIKTWKLKKESNSMNLQFGNAVTGDHKVVPLKGTQVTVSEGIISLPIMSDFGRDAEYTVKLVQANGPFAVVHREHGNITCPQGTYLACVQMDPRTLDRVTD